MSEESDQVIPKNDIGTAALLACQQQHQEGESEHHSQEQERGASAAAKAATTNCSSLSTEENAPDLIQDGTLEDTASIESDVSATAARQIIINQQDSSVTQRQSNAGDDHHSNNNNKSCPLEDLSLDLLAWLLSYLTLPEIAATSITCQRLHRACRSNSLWKLKFCGRWNLLTSSNSGQNWYRAYQQAYYNPHDLWVFHWNCVYPQDGLVPGRCCIYDTKKEEVKQQQQQQQQRHNICPQCRFFPEHPLSSASDVSLSSEEVQQDVSSTTPTKRMAQSTDECLKAFCQQHDDLLNSSSPPPSYQRSKAQIAFSNAATCHRTLETQQYTAAHPHSESYDTYLSPLKDVLFFNVTTAEKDLEHLRHERDLQQQWERDQPTRSTTTAANNSQVFWKPGYETAHHTWHQALVTNPEFVRPMVFRISVQRPECFAVFPSEGYLEPGQSKVITFGVRPLGSLIASLFETINVQRTDTTEDWIQQVWNEEGPLPCVPFVIRYKYSHVIPCIPARGFIPPHLPHPATNTTTTADSSNDHDQEEEDSENNNNGTSSGDNDDAPQFPAVADVCLQQKQLVDFHWSGGDPSTVVESHEVRNIYLSAHVHANYPFDQFCHDTLTPFDVSIDSNNNNAATNNSEMIPTMLYYAAPQLHEFYPNTVFPLLQNVRLEQEVTHAGQTFRSHRQKCVRCLRSSWGPRLEEMGQSYMLARLECFLKTRRQNTLLKNCLSILQCIDTYCLKQQRSSETTTTSDEEFLVRVNQLLYTVYNFVQRRRAAPYLEQEQRRSWTELEIFADRLYSQCSTQQNHDTEQTVWRQSGIYRYKQSTDSVFCPDRTIRQDVLDEEECSLVVIKDEPNRLDSFRRLTQTPGRHNLGPQEDPNHLGHDWKRQRGVATDMFMDNPISGLESALVMLFNPRSASVHGIYDRIPYPGKVVRRPRFPLSFSMSPPQRDISDNDGMARLRGGEVYYLLQDTMNVDRLVQQTILTFLQPLSLRRYLRNIPPPGMGRFPLSIDENVGSKSSSKPIIEEGGDEKEDQPPSGLTSASFRIAALPLPKAFEDPNTYYLAASAATPTMERPQSDRSLTGGNNRRDDPPANDNGGRANNNLNFILGGPVAPPLLRGPAPRLLTLLWSVSAQLGWTADDVGQGAASVFINRKLLIGLQWFSLTLMAGPLLWTLCARHVEWIPCKPVDYQLEDLPYELNNEMRFLSEQECGAAALLIILMWLFLGRWTERLTSRDFFRAMVEHTSRKAKVPFLSRLSQRYKRQWDAICPLFLQRLTYTPEWNRRSFDDLMKHVAFWRSNDFREHRSIFRATLGRGLMFWGGRWNEVSVEDPTSRRVMFALVVALGSFSSSTPNFWMNLLTVFSCSISLGLSMSLHSLETETSGAVGRSPGFLKSLNLPSLVTGSFLIGHLLGSSGGLLFLAEFVVTSISFILGGAGTISASSVESWGCFFCLSSTAFWGYLFGRVSLMDGIIRQKRHVRNKGYSSFLLCSSLILFGLLWILMFLWRWDVPVSLMIVRPNLWKTARRGGAAATTENIVARSATAREYAAKHLQ